MGRVEQYHTHTRVVNGYKTHAHTRTRGYETLPVPITGGYPYPLGTQRVDQIVYKLFKNLHSSVKHLTKKYSSQLNNK